jgi:hypothetical protein
MAEPTAQTLTIAIGQAKLVTVTMDAAPSGGVSGWAVRFRIRRRGAAEATVEKVSGDGVTITDAVNGVWLVTLAGDDTGELSPIQYDWSFWRTDTDTEFPIAFGTAVPYVTAENTG